MSRAWCRGFTLLEVMVVLTILALTLSLVVPAVSRGVSPSLDSVAQDLSTGLRQARNLALGRQQATTFVIDLENHVYFVNSEERNSISRDIKISAVVASREASLGEAVFRFFPDGSSTGGKVLLTLGEASFSVEVDWLTGRVVVTNKEGAR